MSKYNRFGAVYGDVLKLYPGTVVADYDAGGANGQTNIEAVLDRLTLEVVAALSPEAFRQMTRVDAEEVVEYATAGQTAFSLGLKPVVTGSVHLWRYPPPYYQGQGSNRVDSQWYNHAPQLGINEVPTTQYGVTDATGAVALSGISLGLGERVLGSYRVDVDAATFAMPSLAALVVLGAAAELGAVLFSSASQEWALVTQYLERYRGRFAGDSEKGKAFLGEWIPDELRRLRYWKPVERAGSNQWGTVKFDRS